MNLRRRVGRLTVGMWLVERIGDTAEGFGTGSGVGGEGDAADVVGDVEDIDPAGG